MPGSANSSPSVGRPVPSRTSIRVNISAGSSLGISASRAQSVAWVAPVRDVLQVSSVPALSNPSTAQSTEIGASRPLIAPVPCSQAYPARQGAL